MGMVLEHQLSACYAAGSLGGTLGRLITASRRLSRAQSTGCRETTGVEAAEAIEPASLAHLNQTLRMMADAWQSLRTSRNSFGRIEGALDALKERALLRIGSRNLRLARHWEYQLLAQLLDNLKAGDRPWM